MSVSVPPCDYPLARRDASVVDNFHGTKVADPYRWLEDADSVETKDYVTRLNAVSKPFIQACSIRDTMTKRLTALWDYEKYGCTSKHGKYYYYYHNTGLQNQSVLFQQKSLLEPGEVFLDPNTLSSDGTTAIRTQCFSHDGSILAVGLSEQGSDWMTLKFHSAEHMHIEDTVKGVKHSGIDWLHDNTGVFYSRYPEHRSALEGCSTEKHKYHSLYFHKMGTVQTDDVLVADFRNDPELMCGGSVSEDGRFLVVEVSRGCDPCNQLYYVDLKAINYKVEGKLPLQPLFDAFDAKYEWVDNEENTALILTNQNAAMFKLIRVNMNTANQGESNWETVIAEQTDCKLEWVVPVQGNLLIVSFIEHVKHTLYVYCATTGKRLYQIPLQIGSISGFFGRKNQSEIFLSFESFLTPTVIYRANLNNNAVIQLKELRRVQLKGIDTSCVQVKQVFYTSKDNTQVPMYIIHNKDTVLDGTNPTLLNGYGGFNIADMPYFSLSRLLFVLHFHGVVACANLRGGSEYGEKWHEAGMLHNKQNVFDDFIAAAQYLINSKYTSPKRLTIHGGSNGGLLVAACSQQRPDLFGAVLNRVGVLDMLRYHKFTIGGAWLPEFGNPEIENDFEYIYKYSPLHNLALPSNGQWPCTLLMTADHDDRVVPSHSLKYIASLYELLATSHTQTNPVLVRVDVKAGHGAGKPTSKIIAELVDMYSFVQRVQALQWID